MAGPRIDEKTLRAMEARHASGLKSRELLAFLEQHGLCLSEATLRKYVQLGLLPRSVRVGSKGKHQGSQGLYPVSVLRQILRIKDLLTQNYTIEQIQRDFLFMRNELEELERTLNSVFGKLNAVLGERRLAGSLIAEVDNAKLIAHDLMSRLASIEKRLTAAASLRRVSVS